MITIKEIQEIRSYLEKSENPLFFYDDDPDGLCSFLLLKNSLNKGQGICVKAGSLDIRFLRKIKENSPDLIIILDLPVISQELIEKLNVPIIWIDHHPLSNIKGVHYYNPLKNNSEDNRPTSYWCYKITQKSEDLWLALVGCISDCHLPDFAKEFSEKYPDLLPSSLKDPFDILFETKLNKLVNIFLFILKDKTSEVKKSVSILSRIKDPYELINQSTPKAKYLYKKIKKALTEYQNLINEAVLEAPKEDLFIFYAHSKKLAMTGEISNELMHKFPDKLIIVAREKNDKMKISLRGWKYDIRTIFEKSMEGLDAFGGGHLHACGGDIPKENWSEFISRIKKLMKKHKL